MSNITKGNLKFWSLDSKIRSSLVDKKVQCYDGRKFISLILRDYMVGYRLGEFIFTRKKAIYKKTKKK